MDGFARRKEQSKEEIRKAAWELFSQFGVERVSMADIARKAGVSQATIYNNFGSKEALAREFVSRSIEQLVQRVQDVLAPEQPYWDKLAAFIQFLAGVMAQEQPSPADSAIFTRSFDLLNDPEIQKIHTAAQEKMIQLLMGLIQEGKQQGQVEAELTDEAYGIYFKVFMGIFTDPALQPGFARNPRLMGDLGRLMIYGLSGEKRQR